MAKWAGVETINMPLRSVVHACVAPRLNQDDVGLMADGRGNCEVQGCRSARQCSGHQLWSSQEATGVRQQHHHTDTRQRSTTEPHCAGNELRIETLTKDIVAADLNGAYRGTEFQGTRQLVPDEIGSARPDGSDIVKFRLGKGIAQVCSPSSVGTSTITHAISNAVSQGDQGHLSTP